MLFKKKDKNNKEKHRPRLALPAVAKERLRRAGALALALVLFMGAAFSDLPEGILSGLFSGMSAKADGTTTITMTTAFTTSGDAATALLNQKIDRDEDTMWFFYANATSQDIFCLNSGYHLCSSDQYKYTDDTLAANYSNQDAAKAVYWYYHNVKDKGTVYIASTTGSGSGWTISESVARAAVQAYVWGGSNSTERYGTMYTCLVLYAGLSAGECMTLTSAIQTAITNTTNLSGYIYVYTCKSCSNGYSTGSHQVLLGWGDNPIGTPEYSYLEKTEPGVGIEGEEVELTIKKIDSTSKNTIDEATFSLTMDGTTVTSDMVKAGTITVTQGTLNGSTFTTEDGCVKITYTGSYTTGSSKYFGKYWYVIDDGGKAIPSGYYATKALAQAAMDDDIAKWKENQSTVVSTASHTWEATEITAPIGHYLSSDSVTVTTTGSQSKTMTFSNKRSYVADITVNKTYDSQYATIVANAGLSLSGAKYTIYAGETVYNPSDNKTVLYSKNQAITTITTNSSGVAKLSASSTLLPAGYQYYIKETTAPTGWEIDDSVYYFDTSGTTITSEETPVIGHVEIYKNYEDYTDGSRALYPEINATFNLYKIVNGKEVFVETLTTEETKTDTDGIKYGYDISGDLLYGTYVLRQTSSGDGADKTAFMTDQTFTISGNNQVVTYEYTNPDNSAKVRVTKTMTTEDSTMNIYISEAENDAVFYVVDESLLSGLTMESLNNMTADERKAAVEAKASSGDILSLTTGYIYEPVSKTYTTGTDGVAESAVDAGATYWVIQVTGADGYTLADVQSVTVPANDNTYHDLSFDNKEYGVRVELTKYKADYDENSQYSYEAGSEEPEEDAQFYIIDTSSLDNADNPQTLESLTTMNASNRKNWADNYGTVLESFTTDSNGYGGVWFSVSDISDKGWFILQVDGEEGYALMDAITDEQWAANDTSYGYAKFYTYTDGDADQTTVYTVDSYVVDPVEEAYLALYKVFETSNNKFDPEEGAVFYVYDMENNLVGIAITDENGYADVYEPKTENGSYVETYVISEDGTKTTYYEPGDEIAKLPLADYTIKQIYGSAGHELADDETVSLDSEYLYDTYVYGYDKETDSYYYKNWSEDIELDLTKLSSDTGAAVSCATYTVIAMEDVYDTDGSILYDAGETVCTLSTDDDGQASWPIRYGNYSIQETYSPHTFVQDTTIYYFTVDSKGIIFTDSRSDDTSEDPKAPAGHVLKEYQALTYTEEDGVVTAHASITVADEPVFGEIDVEKDTDGLSTADSGSFAWTVTTPVADAVYAIYAYEDITDDAGNVVQYYAVDENGNVDTTKVLEMTADLNSDGSYAYKNPIAYAVTEIVTDEDGNEYATAHFYWAKVSYQYTSTKGNLLYDENAKKTDYTYTDQWYLGKYYVKEITSPYGYALDEETHFIYLTWDLRADEMGDTSGSLRDSTSASARGIVASTGPYVLETGEALNELLTSDDFSEVTSVVFSTSNVAADMSGASGPNWWDVSQDQDGSVMLYKNGTTAYIRPHVSGISSGANANQVIYLNAESAYMFYKCSNLTSIDFDNVDTSLLMDADYMFAYCTGLTTLDLSNWNTQALMYVNAMFYGCTNLVRIYAYSQTLTEWSGTLEDVEYITAYPISYFNAEYTDTDGNAVAADTFAAEDFNFYIYDTNGAQYLLTLTDDDIAEISFSPATSSESYADDNWLNDEESLFYMYVTITFSADSEYAAYCETVNSDGSGSITVPVKVWCIDKIVVPDAITEHPEYVVSVKEKPQTISIPIKKVDEDGNAVGNAEFRLYANCTIVDAYGKIIYEAGDLIDTATTSSGTLKYDVDDQEWDIIFDNLPSDLYAVAGTYQAVSGTYKIVDGLKGDGKNFMYYVQEYRVPLGYDTDNYELKYYVSGSVSDIENTVETEVKGIVIERINPVLGWPTIVKQWDDDTDNDGTGNDEGTRPDYVVYLVQNSKGTNTYVLVMFEDYTLLYDYSLPLYGMFATYGMDSSNISSYQPICAWKNITADSMYKLDEPYWGVILDDANYAASTSTSSGKIKLTDGFYLTLGSKTGYQYFNITKYGNYSYIENTSSKVYAYDSSIGSGSYTLSGRKYVKETDSWTDKDLQNVWLTANTYDDTTNASITKYWNDGNDADGYRPKSLTFTLYQDDSIYYDESGNAVTATLTGSGNTWETYTVTGLPIGYTYTWVEGDFTYSEEYTTTYEADSSGTSSASLASWYDEETNTWITKVTNTHDALVNITITKDWDDDLDDDGTENDDGIRPSGVYVKLMADNVWVDVEGNEVTDDTTADTAIKLTADNSWTSTIEGLPKSSASGTAISYTFEEARNGDTIIVNGNEITLEDTWMQSSDETDYPAETGYASESTVSYDEDSLTWKVSMVNTHDRTPITIKAYKKVVLDDVSFYFGDPEFTFTLTGTTIYGKSYTETHTITITEVTDDSYTWVLDNKTKTTVQRTGEEGECAVMEVTFGNGTDTLVYGNYELSESMDDKAWYLESLETSGGYISDEDASVVEFSLPTYDSVLAATEESGELSATFTNAPYKGTVRVTKKDGDGNTLSNVTFTLVRTDGKITSSAGTDGIGDTYEVTTNSAGVAEFTGLLAGEYTLTEVKTVDGRTLLADNITITVPMSLTEAEADSLGADTTSAVESDDDLYFYTLAYTVTDTAEFDMPLTGADNTKTRMLFIAGIMAFILAILAAKQTKGTYGPHGGGNTPATAGAPVKSAADNAGITETYNSYRNDREGGNVSC